jgi:hypothetical protein
VKTKLFRNPEEGKGSQRAVVPVMMMMMMMIPVHMTEKAFNLWNFKAFSPFCASTEWPHDFNFKKWIYTFLKFWKS